MPWSSKWVLAFPPKPCILSSPLPCVPHVPPISFSLINTSKMGSKMLHYFPEPKICVGGGGV
jgi:hypothetical protein